MARRILSLGVIEHGQQIGRVRRRIVPKVFELHRFGPHDLNTGLTRTSLYWIPTNGELGAALHSQLPNDPTDEDRAKLQQERELMWQQGLWVPNAEDIQAVSAALEIGYMDGVTPVLVKK